MGGVCEVHAVKLMNLSPENGSFLFDQAASEIGSKQPISSRGDVNLRVQSGPLPVVNGVTTLIDLGLEPHSPILLRQFMRGPCHAICSQGPTLYVCAFCFDRFLPDVISYTSFSNALPVGRWSMVLCVFAAWREKAKVSLGWTGILMEMPRLHPLKKGLVKVFI